VSVVVSLKVRVSAGCFHREHSPHAYALIDRALADGSDPTVSLVEHENGPELLVEIAAAVGLATSVINLVVAIIKARSKGIEQGDGPLEPIELIVRRFDGSVEEETILRIGPRDTLDRADLERRLAAAVKQIAQPDDT
jgi:hypothetical protein